MTIINNIGARPNDLSPKAAADKSLLRAAQQFESLFLEKLLGKMRASTSMGNEKQGMGKAGNGMYDLLMDRSVAQKLSGQGGGTGIAQFLYRQWTGETRATVVPAVTTVRRSAAPEAPAAPTLNFDQLTPGVRDNGEVPLRDMLPPTGLEEKNDFSLNKPKRDPDVLAGEGETSHVRGHNNELQNFANIDNDPKTGLSRQRNRVTQGDGDGSLRSHATQAYRRNTNDHLTGGHERDFGTGGGRA